MTCHFLITDATGKSLLVEYFDGKLNVFQADNRTPDFHVTRNRKKCSVVLRLSLILKLQDRTENSRIYKWLLKHNLEKEVSENERACGILSPEQKQFYIFG